MGFVILAITIIVMAVPEGLPMAVVISLAFSVEKMRQMNNLVRDMSACETMGNVTDVCSDKTGTLTENNMTVIDIYYSGNLVSVGNSNTVDKLKKDPDLVDLCCAAVINNSATPDFSKSLKEQLGNKTDMAICEFGFKIGVDYNKVRQIDRVLKMIPFSSDRKKMMTLYQREDGSKFLYVKGAPEAILKECAFYKQDGKSFRIENSWRTNLDENIIRLIADTKARAIGVSKIEVDTYKDGDDISKLENEMTFLGIFGIMDPVRAEVPEAVKTSQGAGITVRMVTGDNVQIGAAIAKECGILPKGWQPSSDDNSVMDGKTFREKVGDLKWKEEMRDDKKVRIPFVGDMYAFTKIEPELRVIGRCLPTDKLLLVTGLQALGKVVAVTGDGANDAPALKKADVGLGMGKTGTDICKDASKIVLLDDKFSTIVTAVKFVSAADAGAEHFRRDQEVHQVPAHRQPYCHGHRSLLRVRHQAVADQRHPNALGQRHHGQLLLARARHRAADRRTAAPAAHQKERAHHHTDHVERHLLPGSLPVRAVAAGPVPVARLVRNPIDHRC